MSQTSNNPFSCGYLELITRKKIVNSNLVNIFKIGLVVTFSKKGDLNKLLLLSVPYLRDGVLFFFLCSDHIDS